MYHNLVLLIRPRLQQEPHHLEVALVAGQGQGGLLELVAVGVDPGAELEQDSGHGAVTRAGRLPVNKPHINIEQQFVGV